MRRFEHISAYYSVVIRLHSPFFCLWVLDKRLHSPRGVTPYQAMAVNESEDRQTGPPSIRQKQILDAAADSPNASMEDLASKIPSATTELVERVLEEYGDPADDSLETSTGSEDSKMVRENASPEFEALSEKQHEVLQEIYKNPTASQRELADTLDISGATVSNRANSIEGFSWDDRGAFAECVFGSGSQSSTENTTKMASNETESTANVDQFEERVATIEQQVTDLASTDRDGSQTPFDDADLMHKVVHACMESDVVTEEEELQILKTLLH